MILIPGPVSITAVVLQLLSVLYVIQFNQHTHPSCIRCLESPVWGHHWCFTVFCSF